GQDTITDFTAGTAPGHDIIEFDHTIFADFGALLSASTQVGADVVISAGADTLTLQNINLASLVANDFRFISGLADRDRFAQTPACILKAYFGGRVRGLPP